MDLTTQLAAQESIIERGFGTFVEVGRAIECIRDERLYLGAFSTFDAYCKQRWGWTRRYANYQMAAAGAAKAITANATQSDRMGTIVPVSEGQVRPLFGLEPEQQRAVWAQVVREAEGRPITAKAVEVVAAPLKQKKARRGPPSLAYWLIEIRKGTERVDEAFENAGDDALAYVSPEDRREFERTVSKLSAWCEHWGSKLSGPIEIRDIEATG